MKIRKLKKQDLNNGFLAALSALTDVNLTKKQALRVMKSRTTQTYVGLIDNIVVATGSLMIDLKFIHGGSFAGFIEDVAVNKAFQGLQLGTKIVKHLIKQAKKQGCYKIMLCCKKDIEPFYEKLGFKVHDSSMRLDI